MESTKPILTLVLADDVEGRTGCFCGPYTSDPTRTAEQIAADAALLKELVKCFGDYQKLTRPKHIETREQWEQERQRQLAKPRRNVLIDNFRAREEVLEFTFSFCSVDSVRQGFATMHLWLDEKDARHAYLVDRAGLSIFRAKIDITDASQAVILKILRDNGQDNHCRHVAF